MHSKCAKHVNHSHRSDQINGDKHKFEFFVQNPRSQDDADNLIGEEDIHKIRKDIPRLRLDKCRWRLGYYLNL